MEFATSMYELFRDDSAGNRIFIKREDLMPFSLGGNKVRIAQAFFEDMRVKNRDTLVGYGNVSSNLCRVLANRCFREKIPCYIICSHEEHEDATSQTSNSRLMELLGAVLIPCGKDEIADKVDEVMEDLTKQGRRPYYIYGNRLGRGNEGVAAGAYAAAYKEILSQAKALNIAFDYIFLPSGTGATQSGLVCGHLLNGDSTKIIGISVSRDKVRGTEILREGVQGYFKLNSLVLPKDADSHICLEDSYRKGGYGCYDEEILSCICRMFQLYGVPMDPTYTGKGFAGMMQYLKAHKITGQNILFLHTGGTPLFYDMLGAGLLSSSALQKMNSYQ